MTQSLAKSALSRDKEWQSTAQDWLISKVSNAISGAMESTAKTVACNYYERT
jgi:hypothetical protein